MSENRLYDAGLGERQMSENRLALYDAAARGDERSVQQLLEQDPLLLHRISYSCSKKTPLHFATIQRKLALVQLILRYNSDLAQELDSQQTSALHVASSEGYPEIVQVLLIAPHMCLSRDCRGWNPLHLAAMRGHVQVLEKLVCVCPLAARMKLDQGMTVLHLCVEYNRLEAFNMLVEKFNEMVNAKDDKGETVLHMAVRNRQTAMVDSLLKVPSLEVNELNLNGMTALDVLTRSTGNVEDSKMIKKNLKKKGGVAHKLKHHYEWLDRKKGALMIAASLIATMAFQVGVNPPGGVWQDDKIADSTDISDDDHEAGLSILATKYPSYYTQFYVINTIGFLASLSIILLLMSGLPIRRRYFMWFLMVITWVAITAVALVYMSSLMILSPDFPTWPVLYIWIGLMTLLVMANTARLTVKVVKNWRQQGRLQLSRLV